MNVHRARRGFTLAEVLVALAVIGIAFAALALVQINNLQASAAARAATDTKAAANTVLEEVMERVLRTGVIVATGARTYDFNDYYWTCPTPATPTVGALAVVDGNRACGGTVVIDAGTSSEVDVAFSIVGEAGIPGEGVLTVTVTATHGAGGQRLTIGNRVTCYDVYPSPTATAPDPCPPATDAGGGR